MRMIGLNDPFIKNGLAEDSLCTLILPFIHSPGKVLNNRKINCQVWFSGGNGMQFADEDMLVHGSCHWSPVGAVRIRMIAML